MKKLFKISFLLAVLCFAVPVYADGDMPTGNKTCTQNCGGLYDGTTPTNPNNTDEQKPDESTIGEIYSWIYEQISEFAG
jgi:hypothetical protein